LLVFEDLHWLDAETQTVLDRLGIDNPSAEYLSDYMRNHQENPAISIECVMKSGTLIEQMGRRRLKPRSERQPN
jgi:hypothetical protein